MRKERSEKMAKITYTNEYITVSIEDLENNVTLDDVMQNLIRPLLLAIGYQPENIADYIDAE